MASKIKVLLTTEGTYPFHQGGVSTWCDILVKELKSVDYVVYSILMDPFVTQKFALPNDTSLIKVPLWGTEEPSEHLSESFSKSFLAKRRTTPKEIEQHFIPLFSRLIEEVIAPTKNPHTLSDVIVQLYEYFDHYEYKLSFKSELSWEAFKHIIMKHVIEPGNNWPKPDVYCLIQSLGWLYRFLNIINTPIPKVDVTHSSAAAFCGIPCVISKLRNDTPYLLTEHGIYLREHYLGLGKSGYSSFLNKFLIRLIHSITSLSYTFADQVSPVCEYNTRWESKFDVDRKRIKVIYNGVDTNVFTEAKPRSSGPPTVVTVARIDPLKDMETLIKSAVIVKAKIPDIRFIIYGSVSVPGYYEKCLALRKELELVDTVEFAGHTTNMAAAYSSGDIVALTSISEAFPYSVVEAMMCGRAVISTDVGGIREAIGDTGIMIAPRDYDALAEGIVRLITNTELRNSLAQDARQRALSKFTLKKVLDLHMESYSRMAAGTHRIVVSEPEVSIAALHRKQRIYAERGYAFFNNEMYMDAIRHFKLAIMVAPESPAAPALLIEVAEAYNKLGLFDNAFLAVEKHKALAHHVETSHIA